MPQKAKKCIIPSYRYLRKIMYPMAEPIPKVRGQTKSKGIIIGRNNVTYRLLFCVKHMVFLKGFP